MIWPTTNPMTCVVALGWWFFLFSLSHMIQTRAPQFNNYRKRLTGILQWEQHTEKFNKRLTCGQSVLWLMTLSRRRVCLFRPWRMIEDYPHSLSILVEFTHLYRCWAQCRAGDKRCGPCCLNQANLSDAAKELEKDGKKRVEPVQTFG